MDKKNAISYLLIILIAIVIICLGVFLFNQCIEWLYHMTIITNPCQLCEQLNNTCTRNIQLNLTGQFVSPKPW
jgi:hypothetical protein